MGKLIIHNDVSKIFFLNNIENLNSFLVEVGGIKYDNNNYFFNKPLPFNYILLDNDMISIVPISRIKKKVINDEGDEVEIEQNFSDFPITSTQRQKISPGRFLSKILQMEEKDKDPRFLKAIEKLVNNFRYNIENKNIHFEIVNGAKIAEVYLEDNYVKTTGAGSTLHNSCMRHKHKQEFLDIYCENSNIECLVCFNTKNEVMGRALLWTLVDGDKFMDRIYYCNEMVLTAFTNEKDIKRYLYNGHYEVKVQLEHVYFDYYPYMDTFVFLDMDKNIVTNRRGVILNGRILRDTNGAFEEWTDEMTLEKAFINKDKDFINNYFEDMNSLLSNDGYEIYYKNGYVEIFINHDYIGNTFVNFIKLSDRNEFKRLIEETNFWNDNEQSPGYIDASNESSFELWYSNDKNLILELLIKLKEFIEKEPRKNIKLPIYDITNKKDIINNIKEKVYKSEIDFFNELIDGIDEHFIPKQVLEILIIFFDTYPKKGVLKTNHFNIYINKIYKELYNKSAKKAVIKSILENINDYRFIFIYGINEKNDLIIKIEEDRFINILEYGDIQEDIYSIFYNMSQSYAKKFNCDNYINYIKIDTNEFIKKFIDKL